MSKSVLIGALVSCFLAVGLIAAVTATVIADEAGDDGGRILRAVPLPAPGPVPMPGPGGGRWQIAPELMRRGDLKRCFEREHIKPGTVLPHPLRACMGHRGVR